MRYAQVENAECGLACLAYAASRFGGHTDLSELRRRYPVSSRGLNLRQLTEIASSLGLAARAVKCELDEVPALKPNVILHWNLNHFVVYEKMSGRDYVIFDPAKGNLKVSRADFSKQFSGIALELSPTRDFRKRREKSPLSLWSWLQFTPNLTSGIVQALLLSLALQAYVLFSPLYMQLAVDQGALKGDTQLLQSLAIGFGLFGLFNIGANLLRSLTLQQVSAHLSWDMGIRLFRHLVRLPLPWFQRRRLADTLSRFDSINPIRDLISGPLLVAIVDGGLALTTLAAMYLFSWQLAVFATLSTALQCGIRFCALPHSLRLSGEVLSAQIAENGKRIETVRAIQTIKAMSAELEQEGQWASRYAALIYKTQRKSRFQFLISNLNSLFDTLTSVLIVYVGATHISNSQMTVGILYAFISYKTQFSGAVSNVVDQSIQFYLCDIYSYRLADIVLTPKENGVDTPATPDPSILGEIRVENLAYRYSTYESFVFKNINFTIKPGQMVAITGASGAGKSTLLKILCGLYEPSVGDVRLDGMSLSGWGPTTVRRAMGVVMQDDELLAGTIAENVAFFDEHIDIQRVWTVLDMASMKHDVMQFPMKLETFVGDMGRALSGGQKQRLMLARALYKNPALLFLDEATSHLDPQNEAAISENLRQLNITRVVVAHRQETIQAADRVLSLTPRGLEEIGSPGHPLLEILAGISEGKSPRDIRLGE